MAMNVESGGSLRRIYDLFDKRILKPVEQNRQPERVRLTQADMSRDITSFVPEDLMQLTRTEAGNDNDE